MQKINCGIVGSGFVGSAVATGLRKLDCVKVREYDKYKKSDTLEDTVQHSDILFMCLPTPMNDDGSCDISIIEESIGEITYLTLEPKLFVIKSTVPPQTTEKLAQQYKGHSWVFNPEFLTERNYINDFLEQDRIILGLTNSLDSEHNELLLKLYSEFTKWQAEEFGKNAVLRYCKSVEAEMVKYATNCFLATKLSFFNEIYQLCKKVDADYDSVKSSLLTDNRIGKSHIDVPGWDGDCGYGGKCLYKDINALIHCALENGVDPKVIRAAHEKNLEVRTNHDWDKIPGATSKNLDFDHD